MTWQDVDMAKKVAKKKAPHSVVSEAGARFRLARETLGLTQGELATKGGCLQPDLLEHLSELVRRLQARHRPADAPGELPAAGGNAE